MISNKEQIQELINKIQVLSVVMENLNLNHTEFKDRIEKQYKAASDHKLKLSEEVLRKLHVGDQITVVNDLKVQ